MDLLIQNLIFLLKSKWQYAVNEKIKHFLDVGISLNFIGKLLRRIKLTALTFLFQKERDMETPTLQT